MPNDELKISLIRELVKPTYLEEKTDTQIKTKKHWESGHLADRNQKRTRKAAKSLCQDCHHPVWKLAANEI